MTEHNDRVGNCATGNSQPSTNQTHHPLSPPELRYGPHNPIDVQYSSIPSTHTPYRRMDHRPRRCDQGRHDMLTTRAAWP